MSLPPGPLPSMRPIPTRSNGDDSVLLELHACPTPPTYLQAFHMDIKRGVVADISEAVQAETRPATLSLRPRQTTVDSSGIQARDLPRMAAGGLESLSIGAGHSSVHSSRSPTPAPMRSQNVGQSAYADLPPLHVRQVEDGRDAPDGRLRQAGRILDTRPIDINMENQQENQLYVGHGVEVEILCPNNLQSHKRGQAGWKSNYGKDGVVKDNEGLPLKFLLLPDLGTMVHSWVFCNLLWDRLGKHGDFTAHHEKCFLEKNRIWRPPLEHLDSLDPDNTATVTYGFERSPMKISQTLVKLQFKTRARRTVTLPEFPVGAVCAVSPGDLERSEDGILALGRQRNAKSEFKDPRWPSQTLVRVLRDNKKITTETFTIFVDHPILVEDPANCIIFGPVYNPEIPHIPSGDDAWTSIPALPRTGHWKVYLLEMWYMPAKNRDLKQKIEVKSEVLLDNGCSQTYLHKSVTLKLKQATGLDESGPEKTFDKDDEIEFVFARDAAGKGETISIVGQAKRFFTSPYLRNDGNRAVCIEQTPSDFILGLNFFTTFMVSFDDARDPSASVFTQPHRYV